MIGNGIVNRALRGGYKLLGIVGALALWEVLSLFFPPVILPSVGRVFSSLGQLATQGELWEALGYTGMRAVVGFGISVAIGSTLGVLTGLVKPLYEMVKPVTVVMANVPPIAWVLLAIIWFGLGNAPPIFAIMSIAIPIVTVNLAQGIRDLDPLLQEMAGSFLVKRYTRIRHLYLPAIAGPFFSALSIGTGLTWRVVVMAEFLGSMSGIGNELNWARFNIETEKAFAYVLLIAILGLATEYLVVRPLQSWATRWQRA